MDFIKHHLKHHTHWVRSVAFHPSLPLLATGSDDNSTILYDISSSPPTVKHHLKHHTIFVMSVAFHPSLPLLATSSWDNSTILYNLERW
jgi:WD40 repeat protein